MVVTNEHTLARVFAANHVARNRVGHNARVRKCKIICNDAAPPVRAKLNRRNHEEQKYTRTASPANSRIGLPDSLKELYKLLLLKVFNDLGDILGSVAGANKQRVGSLHDD